MFQRRPGRPLRSALIGIVAAGALVGAAAPAAATPRPPNPSDQQIGSARAQQQAAAAEVGRIAGLVAAAEAELEKVGVQAEAAGTASLAADEALQEAQAAAQRSAAALQTAAASVAGAQARIARFSHDSYMSGSRLASSAALLDSAGPGELIQRAATLDYVASNQLDVLGQLQVARIRQANADSAARQARNAMAAAQAAAEQAKKTAEARLAEQQSAFDRVTAQKATYETQLRKAQIHLLQLQGARNAYQQWVAQRRAEAAAAAAAAARAAAAAQVSAQAAGRAAGVSAASSGYVLPTSGRVSSCFGWRWGALHAGVDLAAAIGTPIYAATSGTVRRAGPATGFGLALYIEGDDGAVTVYGHVNRYFVYAGERVSAGEQIAEVGNRGQSTGPHLHFEVHPSGQMYAGAVDPVPWLNARGIYLGGCGG
jgi:murein DD-endopeptidase MepM/ murein hydrolase activator NlpD